MAYIAVVFVVTTVNPNLQWTRTPPTTFPHTTLHLPTTIKGRTPLLTRTFRTSFFIAVRKVHSRHPDVTVHPLHFRVPTALTRASRLLITCATAARSISVVIRKKTIGKIRLTSSTSLVPLLQLEHLGRLPWLAITYLGTSTLLTLLRVLRTPPLLLVTLPLVLSPLLLHLPPFLLRLPLVPPTLPSELPSPRLPLETLPLLLSSPRLPLVTLPLLEVSPFLPLWTRVLFEVSLVLPLLNRVRSEPSPVPVVLTRLRVDLSRVLPLRTLPSVGLSPPLRVPILPYFVLTPVRVLGNVVLRRPSLVLPVLSRVSLSLIRSKLSLSLSSVVVTRPSDVLSRVVRSLIRLRQVEIRVVRVVRLLLEHAFEVRVRLHRVRNVVSRSSVFLSRVLFLVSLVLRRLTRVSFRP